MGPVETELRLKQDFEFWSLFSHKSKDRLSPFARAVVNSSYHRLTGMQLHVNRCYLPEALSEAIEAAEALDL